MTRRPGPPADPGPPDRLKAAPVARDGEPPVGAQRVRVSVVVPTYRRPELLCRCLAALLSQDLDPSAYEVIVVDDGASEETRRLVESLNGRASTLPGRASPRALAPVGPHRGAGHPPAPAPPGGGVGVQGVRVERPGPTVRYLAMTGRRGPAAARNLGWRQARGAIIAFTDDCVPDAGWLRAGLAAFGPGVLGVSGRLVMPLPEEPTDYERDAARLQAGEFVTANCFYRRAALAAVGGFDEHFTAAWREDTDLYFSLLELSARLPAARAPRFVHAPDAVVLHPIRPAPWGISLAQQRKSRFNAPLYKKHRRLYRERVQPGPPWRYYATVGLLLGGAAAGALGRAELALLLGGGWLLLTGRFCAERLRGTSRAPRHLAELVVTSALIPALSIFWRLRGAVEHRALFF